MAREQGDSAAEISGFPDVLARIGSAAGALSVSVPEVVVPRPQAGPLRVLIVTARPAWRKKLVGACLSAGMACEVTDSGAEACAVLGRAADACGAESDPTCDLVIADGDIPALVALLNAATNAGAAVVLGMQRPEAREVIEAMRLGAQDVLERDGGKGRMTPAVGDRLAALANGSRNQRLGRQRIFALQRMCRRLNHARQQVVRQVDALCSDLLLAYQEVEQHMNQVSTAAEFKGLIKGELDIEALLRTTLEFVLSKSGPTNAAVFLPTTSGDYSLGAYVNYDCPKDTCDVLLDHLANVIAPKFERTTGLINLTTPEQLERYIADDADWLQGSNVVGFACRHEGEVLAIFMLFRDRKSSFAQTVLDQVKTVGELFAAQLARVIHIHHRHLPKDKWGMMGDPNEGREDDYGDLAA